MDKRRFKKVVLPILIIVMFISSLRLVTADRLEDLPNIYGEYYN